MADSSGGLMGIDPDMLLSLGSGLMSMGHYGTNPGQAMAGAMQNYYATKQAKQTLQMNQMQMQQLQAQMPQIQAWGNLLAQKMGHPAPGAQGPQQAPQQAQAPQAPPMPGAPVGPPPGGAVTPTPMPQAQTAGLMQQPQVSQQAQAPQQASSGGLLGGISPEDATQLSVLGAGLPFGISEKAKALAEAAKLQLENDPQNLTRVKTAQSDLAQDQYALEQARSSGNELAFKAAQMKFLKDSGLVNQSSMSGAVQTFAGITPEMLGMNTYNPSQGVRTVNGVESPIPGAPQAEATLAGAKAGAESASQYAPIYDASGTQVGFAPRASIVSRAPGSAPPAAGAGGAPAKGGVTFGIGPQQGEMLKGNAEHALATNKEFQSQAEAGNSMLSQVQTLRNSANDFTPGRFANSRATMLDYLNSAGLISADQKKELGSYQEGTKIAIQLQAAATKQLGSREAAQVFQYMGKSLPNLTLSQGGLEKVAAWQEGISRYQIARAQDANNKAQANDAPGVNQTQNNWIKGSNPLFYVFASAKPDVRQEMLNSLGAKRQQFVTQWNQAARAGMAPMPNDYWPQ